MLEVLFWIHQKQIFWYNNPVTQTDLGRNPHNLQPWLANLHLHALQILHDPTTLGRHYSNETFRINSWCTCGSHETRGQTLVTKQTCVSHLIDLRYIRLWRFAFEKLDLCQTRVFEMSKFQFTICNVPESATCLQTSAMTNDQQIFFSHIAA